MTAACRPAKLPRIFLGAAIAVLACMLLVAKCQPVAADHVDCSKCPGWGGTLYERCQHRPAEVSGYHYYEAPQPIVLR